MNIHMQQQTTGMHYLLKDKQNNACNKLHDPEWVTNLMTGLAYVQEFDNGQP